MSVYLPAATHVWPIPSHVSNLLKEKEKAGGRDGDQGWTVSGCNGGGGTPAVESGEAKQQYKVDKGKEESAKEKKTKL